MFVQNYTKKRQPTRTYTKRRGYNVNDNERNVRKIQIIDYIRNMMRNRKEETNDKPLPMSRTDNRRIYMGQTCATIYRI